MLRALLSIGLFLGAPPTVDASTGDFVACEQDSSSRLSCRFRLAGNEAPRARLQIGTESIVPDTVWNDTGPIAVLVLVDTSDPARAAAVARAGGHARALRDAAPEHYRVGLARFDSNLVVLCEPGCTDSAFDTAARSLAATGRTTELFRSTIAAIDRLGARPEPRRLLVMMSDGLAEDFAYGHEDTIAAATRNSVTIAAVGYARSVSRSVALQTLRRLAEETGGHFAAADGSDYRLLSSEIARLLATLPLSGYFTFELDRFDAAGPTVGQLTFAGRDAAATAVALRLPPTPAPAKETVPAAPPLPPRPAASATSASAAPPAAERRRAPDATVAAWPVTALAAALGCGLVVTIGVALALNRRRPSSPKVEGSVPYAFLLGRYDDSRHTIARTPWRIGRSRNNDLRIEDDSISRVHAEIRRSDGGSVSIHDLNSLNGIFINDRKAEAMDLAEGDIIEIGDLAFRFTLHDEDYAEQSPTVLVATLTPRREAE